PHCNGRAGSTSRVSARTVDPRGVSLYLRTVTEQQSKNEVVQSFLEQGSGLADMATVAEPSVCPRCGADDWIRDGHAARRRGDPVQVFRCRPCGKKRTARSDGPFKHPLFPPGVMVAAVLMRQASWTLSNIAEGLALASKGEEARGPNRQTVGRWLKKLTPVVEELQSRAPLVASGTESSEAPAAEPTVAPVPAVAVEPTRPSPPRTAVAAEGALFLRRFAIERVLLQTDQGGVFVARDRWQGGREPLVLKVVGGAAPAHEFRLRAGLDHPNVASVRDFGIPADGTAWFTQQLVSGPDLLEAGRSAAFERILEWMVGVLRGCVYLHGRGVLHRDIKPENILVGSDGRPRIVDFGISRAPEQAELHGVSGSLGYTAPELLEGAPPDASVDLYAVGLTFYHVLARELPAPGAPLTPLHGLRPDAAPWFDTLLARLCHRDRTQRFAHAVAVIDAIVQHSGIRFTRETPETIEARIRGGALQGRQAALQAIDRGLDQRGAILVQGPAGIGKTRLLRAWRTERQLCGGTVVDAALDTMLQTAITRLGATHPTVRRHADVVARLSGGDADHPMPSRPRDGILRDREAVLELLAAGLPPGAVLVLDDVDRADEPTVAVIDALLAAGRTALVLTARAVDQGTGAALIGRWVAGGQLEVVRLEALPEETVAAIIADAFDGSTGVATDLAARIWRAGEGNPRFVEEVLSGLVEQGTLRRGDDGGWLVESAETLPVPEQLVDVCSQRIAALDEETRRLLVGLAVAERPVPQGALGELAGQAALATLLERSLIRQTDGPLGVAEPAHDGVRRAAVRSLTPDALRQARIEVADAVERAIDLPDARPADLLARLLVDAGEPDRAVGYMAGAARRARDRWDVGAATAWLTELDSILSRPDVEAPEGLAVETLRGLAAMLRFSGHTDEHSVCLDRLSLVAQMSGDTGLLYEATALKAIFWFDRRRYDLARQIAAGHLAGSRDIGDRLAPARFLWVLAMAACAEGDLTFALDLSDEALEQLGDATDPEALDLRVQSQINRGNVFGRQGRLDRAAGAFERALSLSRRHDLVSSSIVATMNLGICHAMQCRYGPALEHFDRARSDAQRLGWVEMGHMLQANQAEVERNLGLWTLAADRAGGLVRADVGAAAHVAASARCTVALSRAALGDVRAGNRQIEAARGGGTSARLSMAEAAVRLAEGTNEARNLAVAALESATEAGAPHEVALALARLAQLALGDGVPERALALVEDAFVRSESGHREVREGLIELLYTRARTCLALGDTANAATMVERAVEELSRQCVELRGAVREAFLAIPLHAELVREGQRLLGRLPGFAAQVAPVDEGTTHQLKEVLALTRRLTRAAGLGAVVELVLDCMLRYGHLDRACLLTRQEQGFASLGARRAGQAPLEPDALRPAAHLLDAATRTRRATTEHDASRSTSPGLAAARFHCLAVPLCYGDRVVGAVYLESEAGDPGLEDHRRLLLESVADQAAMAVQYHLQLDEIERLRRHAQADLTRTRARLAQEAARRERAERAVEAERREIKLRYSYDQIIHRSQAMREVLAQVDRVVDRKITVLVNGESGTGKELIARALHYSGPRAGGPFVAINCGAIPNNLIESELFGHVRGAFTGAHKDRRGHFELAHRGTLFLDELGEIAPDVQVRLLRVLETAEVTPVGSSRRIKVDVRIVAATNKDLRQEVAEGRFREDLLYRINAVTLTLPPLRDRPEDIELLLLHFTAAIGRDRGEPAARFSPGLLERFAAHSWPGNVRELRNVVEYATLFADGGEVPEDLKLPF
ncbi:MAG: transcriptional regulator with GAF, ATPase, and Fis domain/transposase-like protein, partial [Myxococcota bacterium]